MSRHAHDEPPAGDGPASALADPMLAPSPLRSERTAAARGGSVEIESSPAGLRRRIAGLSLVAAPLLALVGGVVTPWESSDTTAGYLDALGASPARAQVSAVLLYLGFLLFVPAAFGVLHLLRGRGVTLAHVGGALAVLGFATIPGLVATDFYDLSLAQSADRAAAIAISDRANEYPGQLFFVAAVLLGQVGLVLLAAALRRARFVPLWVPLAALVGQGLVIVGPLGPGASFVAGFAVLLAAFGYVGARVFRISDGAWERGVG